MKTPFSTGDQSGDWGGLLTVCRLHARPNFRLPQRALRLSLHAFLLIGLLLGTLGAATNAVIAQAPPPQFMITGIDASAFPEVRVSVYGENMGTHLTETPLTLTEDGVPKEAVIETEATGAQTLLVIDTYAGIVNPGMTGAPRIEEIAAAVSQLTEQQYLLADKDWLGFISFENSESEATPMVFSPWSENDHQKVINAVLQYATTQVENAKSNTPLFDLLFTSIHYFDDRRPPQNLPRSIVVFSNGVDIIAVAQKEDLIRLARERNIRIHTVQFGPTDNREAQQNLQNLALNTGGQYVHLNQENALLDGLWESVQYSQLQRVLTYRSTNASPARIEVVAQAGGLALAAERNFPTIDVRAPQIVIVEPVDGTLVKVLPGNEPLLHNTPIDDLEPKELTVAVDISWPDGYVRELQRVEYVIGDRTFEVLEAPFDTFVFPIDTFDQGDYTLRVTAFDELGLRADASPKPLVVVVDRPQPPDIGGTATAAAAEAQVVAQVAASTATAEANATATMVAANAAEMATAEAISAEATAAAFAQANAAAEQRANELGANLADLGSQNETLRYYTYGGYATALLALFAAIFVWVNPRTRKRATQIVSGTIGRFTEFWSPDGTQQSPSRQLRARLAPMAGAPDGKAVEIYNGSARIGRDPALATVVINDPRVSRYHCRISEESNGVFRIWDEGSTSGTYVNSEPITMAGRALHAGDLVNFGPVQYRFEPVPSGSNATSTVPGGLNTDATVAYVMTPNTPSSTGSVYAPRKDHKDNVDTVGAPDYSPNQTQPSTRAGLDTQSTRPARETDPYMRPPRAIADDATQIAPPDDATRG